jgi:hypothetical protein
MIAFCTTCKGREQHLKQTLPRNLADNENFADCKFIVLDYGSTGELAIWLQREHRADIANGRLVYYRYPHPDRFYMAHAKNMAHRCGILEGDDILVNLDADNFTGKGFAAYIAQQFRETNIFLWAKMVKDGPGRLSRGISGRIAVSVRQFLLTGGYDERFETWGPDDKDFNLRLGRFGFLGIEIQNRFLGSVLHTEKMRFREYPHARSGVTDQDFADVCESETTVANFGIFGCGTVYRNFQPEPIELGPVPTRIFGIGMHKTGTTSLHAALQILGFDSAHWKDAHWAKDIWLEMNGFGKSRTVEGHYALSDLPITLLYEKLDLAYPGSKFILTVRDDARWLESVKNHWAPDLNHFRWRWDNDPFTHIIHKQLYGQKGFNAEIFLARYRRHNAEVKQYFRRRPSDLLVLDVDKGMGWRELCRFLDKPIPKVAYPRRFRTDRTKR